MSDSEIDNCGKGDKTRDEPEKNQGEIQQTPLIQTDIQSGIEGVINSTQQALALHTDKIKTLSRVRLFSFLGFAFALYYGFTLPWAFVLCPIALAVFYWSFNRYQSASNQKKHLQGLLAVNRLTLARVTRDWSQLHEECEYPSDKSYWRDLNIGGKRSLMAYASGITSSLGLERLADWLQGKAATETIVQRQQAQQQLADKLDLRQNLNVQGRLVGDIAPLRAMNDWFKARHVDVRANIYFKRLLLLWNVCGIAGIACAAFGLLPPFITVVYIGVNIGLLALHVAKIKQTYFHSNVNVEKIEGLRRVSELMESLNDSLPEKSALIECALAQLLGKAVDSGSHGSRFSDELIQLKRLVFYSEVRFNAIAYAFLNILFAWDLHLVKAIEIWAQRFSQSFDDNLSAIAELEAVLILSSFSYENPDWHLPSISDDLSSPLIIEEGAHPLLMPGQVVANSVTVDADHRFNVITGSHMSGKTTFLRMIGINTVLAMAGGSVCAKSMSLPRTTVLTSMHVADSLLDGVSLFMAEAIKIKQIIQHLDQEKIARHSKVLFLLDEVLRGSNDLERKTVFVKLLQKLKTYDCYGLISTNDIFIAKSEEVAASATYYHFQESVAPSADNLQFIFDYKIRPGVVTQTNALHIMQSMAIV